MNDFDVKFLTTGGEGPSKRSYPAQVEPDGAFIVNGSIGKGLPPGRYKVIVVGLVLDANGKPALRYRDTFLEKMTPLEVEITAASRDVIIDPERKTVQIS
ncbi:MAG: hypothetical protein JWO38_212 [Gemmataceae bacterium]|nr:hypothetical protein [Gemmataceae bacterium]